MTLKGRRANIKHGCYSHALILPAQIEIGKESTFACGRLMVIDPRGEIHEDDLLAFLENHVEPDFWIWFKKKREDVRI